MIKTCELVLKDCLPCNDDPIANISAELPDVDVFIGFRDFRGNPPLGVVYAQLGCKAICFSTVSQQEANDCAIRQAQGCVWPTWQPPLLPPIPPGPGNTGGKGTPPNTPGGIPPMHPRRQVRVFANTLQLCSVECPDGSLFTEYVAAGTITALSQALADEQAHALACQRAQQNLFCISAATPPSACTGESYFFRLNSSGGLDLLWFISQGSLPPGLNLDPLTGIISGTPVSSGVFDFKVDVSDSLGRIQSKDFSICIMEIVTAATLPPATEGDVYAQPLIQEPAGVTSEVWTLVGGSLPPGITLAPNGALNGTPTEVGVSEFTLQVDATCNGSAVSCQKFFNLEVLSGVDCMGAAESIGAASWTQVSSPLAGTITVVNGDGTFSGVSASDPFVEAEATICNPSLTPYDFTADIDWTTAGGFAGLLSSQAIVKLNGVNHASPIKVVNGTFNFQFAGQMPSGVNTLRVYCTFNSVTPGTLNGTCTIRPLVPPP